MSTRSAILIERENGSFKGIYCHWDGYLEHNGKVLFEHYQDREKVEKLISLGDLSSLGKNIEPKTIYHTFKTPEYDVCVFYHRDRLEEGCEPFILKKFEELKELKKLAWCEYIYIYGSDGKWRYTTNFETPHDLKEALEKLVD